MYNNFLITKTKQIHRAYFHVLCHNSWAVQQAKIANVFHATSSVTITKDDFEVNHISLQG